MALSTIILTGAIVILILLNLYQFLSRRFARRTAEVFYIMSRNAHEKSVQAVQERESVQILEAHLLDLLVSLHNLLRALGYPEKALGFEPEFVLSVPSRGFFSRTLIRRADNILYAALNAPDTDWDRAIDRASERLRDEIPGLKEHSARNLLRAIACQNQKEAPEQLASHDYTLKQNRMLPV